MERSVVPFRAEHLEGLQVQSGQIGEVQGRDVCKETKWLETQTYPSFTGMRSGDVIGAAGVIPCGLCTGDGWMWLRKGADRWDVLWFFRQTKKVMDALMTDPQYLTITTVVRCDWPQAHRFVKLLGFANTMVVVHPFNDNKSYDLYERLSWDSSQQDF